MPRQRRRHYRDADQREQRVLQNQHAGRVTKAQLLRSVIADGPPYERTIHQTEVNDTRIARVQQERAPITEGVD